MDRHPRDAPDNGRSSHRERSVLAEKKIHTKSFTNVETERLHARLDYLRTNLQTLTADQSREGFRGRVREIVNCERELTRRGCTFDPVSDGSHLLVDVVAVPLIRPFTRADTHYPPRSSEYQTP